MDWQPIETAPKDGTDMLLIRNYGVSTREGVFIGWFNPITDKWVNLHTGSDSYGPTHWMALPAPPNA